MKERRKRRTGWEREKSNDIVCKATRGMEELEQSRGVNLMYKLVPPFDLHDIILFEVLIWCNWVEIVGRRSPDYDLLGTALGSVSNINKSHSRAHKKLQIVFIGYFFQVLIAIISGKIWLNLGLNN